jgi:thymidylate synthase
MYTITGTNVHTILPIAIDLLYKIGQERDSRAGKVLVSPYPITTMYYRPTERVLFHKERDANPFFHLFEVLWMLAGRDDVAWLAQFNSNIAAVASDNGITFHGAYGKRWNNQINLIIDRLRKNPLCRRQVLSIWNKDLDLSNQDTKDLPCNLVVHFQINYKNKLDMTVFCRSNDIIWGCYGSDAVTFSILQEYVACSIGVPVGYYWQISNNYHGYLNTMSPLKTLCTADTNPYTTISTFPLFKQNKKYWDRDLKMFIEEGTNALGYKTPFFRRVAVPMLTAYTHFRELEAPLRYSMSIKALTTCKAADWALAATEWIERRRDKWIQKNK